MIFWDLLSQVTACTSLDDPIASALLSCVGFVMDGAAQLLRHGDRASVIGVAEIARNTIVGMLPLMCAGLSLLGSFTRALATRLLPAITNLLGSLHEAALPTEREVFVDDDFNLTFSKTCETEHPHTRADAQTVVYRHAGHTHCFWLKFDPRSQTSDHARLEVLADGKVAHTLAVDARAGRRYHL